MIGKTVSHYRILEKLGEGGMGVVYKAEDAQLKRTVALKFLSPQALGGKDDLARFINEAQAAASLDHENICTIYEINRTEEHTYIVMAYVEGRSLRERISSGRLDVGEALDIAAQIGEGLREAHERGIVHRDIKPANIMITAKGRAKIMDFGVARLPGGTELTKTGTSLGTAAYMSPEQVRGERVDCRTDIWSLGAVLYEMVAGKRPFRGDYEPAVLYSILNESPEPLGGTPVELGRIIDKALAKPMHERYQSVEEMLADLAALRSKLGADSSGRVAGASRRRGKRIARSYMRVAVFAILIVAASLLLLKVLGRHEDETAGGRKEKAGSRAPAAVSLTQVTFSEDLEEYPALSSEGDKLAYCRETDGHLHLFIKYLKTGEEIQVSKGTQDDIQPAWSPDGDAILFVRSNQPGGRMEPWDVFGPYDGGDVWRMDLKSGKERKLMENAFNPAFSPDGEHIAVDASWAGPRRIWVTDAQGRNPLQVSDDPSEAVAHIVPSWSPDGLRLAVQNIERTKFDIKVVDIHTREMKWVTNDTYTDINPVWSGSGNEVFFSSYRGGGMNIWRVAVSPDGTPQGQPIQVTTGPGQDVQLSAPQRDGRLAFSILKINADIWRLPIAPETGVPTGDPQSVIATTREDSRGAWSPDGKQIAFNSDRTGDMNIWLYSFSDGSTRQLTKGPGGDYQANWSPDGERLAFFSSRSGNADIWTVSVGTGELKQLTTDSSLDFNPFFSPDGRHIGFQSDRYGRKELWVMRADGTEQRQLTETGIGGHFMRWRLDGSAIVFNRPGAKPSLYSVPLGGDPEPFADLAGGGHASFSPDQSMGIDVVGHKVIWVTSVRSGDREKVFEFPDPDIRIDYPVWSPDGRWLLLDRLKPQGGDIWIVENLGR